MGKRKAKSVTEEINPLMLGCPLNACRVNCKKNPNCFNNIGEKFWFKDIDDTYWINCEDPEESRKTKGNHVGVKNLGATCYMNAFLQLWFHNRKFRKAIYDWRSTSGYEPVCHKDSLDPHEQNDVSIEQEKTTPELPEQLVPYFGDGAGEAVCACLQYLFTMLQHSEKRYIDPSSIVQCLGLQPDEQQDAQEFSKLFISLLEDALVLQNNNVDNIVSSQFGGEYFYETTCSTCGNLSQRPSKFYELDLNIKGHSNLKECIREFLKEEVLEGDNKYFCSKCNLKNNAVRRIKLNCLPPVLNFQLLRFVFDRETGMKRKLNSVLQFPDVLDMNKYMHFENKSDGLYELVSVLLHRGPSAHSGHYVAHILEEETECWYRCNDEDVQVIKGRKLQLGKEEDLEVIQDDGTVKKQKQNKTGFHSSKNAYMLVYCRSSEKKDICKVSPPPYMEEIVASDNSLFEGWVEQVKRIRDSMVSKGKERQQEIQRIFNMLQVKPEDDYEWISIDWLKSWLKPDLITVPPIDNTPLLCKHAKADPQKMHTMKRISIPAADYFYNRFGGLPRLKSDALCSSCLDKDAKTRDFEAKIKEDQQLMVPILKPTYKLSDDGYWVGKTSLKQWKQLATKIFEASLEDSCSETDSPVNGKQHSFNEEIVCLEHGNLSTEIHRRILVPNQIWELFNRYFKNARAFTYDSQICQHCQANDETTRDEKEAYKLVAKEQKSALQFLLNRNPSYTQSLLQQAYSVFHVLTTEFVSDWKRYVRSMGKPSQPVIDMSDLVCDHGMLLYNAEEIIDEATSNDGGLVLLTPDEHKLLIQMYQFSNEVTLLKQTLSDRSNLDEHICEMHEPVNNSLASENELDPSCDQALLGSTNPYENGKLPSADLDLVNTSYATSPDYCQECRLNRLKEEALESEGYKYAAIYVMKQKSSDFRPIDLTNGAVSTECYDKGKSPLPENSCSVVINDLSFDHKEKTDSLPKTPINDQYSHTNGVDDGLPKDLSKRNKRESTESSDLDYVTPPSHKKSKRTPVESSSRKSSRQRTKRGEYLLRVDSDHTLKQLKIQLLNLFSVLPCDQHIRFESGEELKGDERTLADLKVRPETHLLMCVDEPNLEPGLCVEDISSVNTGSSRVAEEGFKGTSLLGNSHTILQGSLLKENETSS